MESSQEKSPETGKVGIITAIETEITGKISVSEITPEIRRDWCEDLVEKLADISGIENVYIAGLSARNQSAHLEVVLDATETTAGNTKINGNLRSISQQMRHAIDDVGYTSSYEYIETPTRVAGEETYDNPLYIVDVWFY